MLKNGLPEPDTVVLMKPGKHMEQLKAQLSDSDRCVFAAENCGTPQERIYHGTKDLPEWTGYYTLLLTKKKERKREHGKQEP